MEIPILLRLINLCHRIILPSPFTQILSITEYVFCFCHNDIKLLYQILICKKATLIKSLFLSLSPPSTFTHRGTITGKVFHEPINDVYIWILPLHDEMKHDPA